MQHIGPGCRPEAAGAWIEMYVTRSPGDLHAEADVNTEQERFAPCRICGRGPALPHTHPPNACAVRAQPIAMKKSTPNPAGGSALRQRAEQEVRQKPRAPDPEALSEAEARRLVHELEVHQIELEMQNQELIQAQASAAEAADQATDLFDFAPVSYFVLDPHGAIRKLNLAGAALLGLERSRAVGRVFGLHVAPDSQAAFNRFRQSLSGAEGRRTCELRLLQPKGGFRDVVVEGAGPGEDKGFRLTVTDVTETQRAQAALQEANRTLEQHVAERTTALAASEERLRLALCTAELGVLEWDAAGDRAVWGNPRMFVIHGVRPEDGALTRAQFAVELVVPEDRPLFEAALADALKPGQSYHAVFRIRRRNDGDLRWLEATGAFERAPGGQPWRLVAVVRDITERKRIEDTLRFLVDGGRAASGQNFFQSVAQYLARNLDADYVCIDRLQKGLLAADTLAVYFDGKFEDNVSYTLKDTPCGAVVAERVCCFPRDVRRLFPKDEVLQQMGAESYLGTVLWSSQGQPIGLIALIARRPMVHPELAQAVLQLVGGHTAAELERRQGEEALRASNAELEHFNRVMVGRELRMIELKKEVNELCARAGQAPRYSLESDPPPPLS